MRALLDLMRANESALKIVAEACHELLERASFHLKVLDPEVGEEELIKAVLVADSTVRYWMVESTE